MLPISSDDISARLRADNPWWSATFDTSRAPFHLPRRAYHGPLKRLITSKVRRAVVLLGSRRVGKTTLLQQLIGEFALSGELGPVLFASIDTPTYTGLSPAHCLELFEREQKHDPNGRRLVVFDEIQYLKDWESTSRTSSTAFPPPASSVWAPPPPR